MAGYRTSLSAEELARELRRNPGREEEVLRGFQVGAKPAPPPRHPAAPQTESEAKREEGQQERGGPVNPHYYPTPSTHSSHDGHARTVAEGYDRSTQTMKIWFGDRADATPYEYYGVTPREHAAFHRVKSPGRYINRVLNSKTYGPAPG